MSATLSEETVTMLAPSVHVNVDRITRLTELTVGLHMVRSKAASYERRLNEMVTITLNDGIDPVEIHEATGLTYDEMLIAEKHAFRTQLNDNARLKLLGLVGDVPHYGELGDGSHLADTSAGMLHRP